jgi:hypothetical protein
LGYNTYIHGSATRKTPCVVILSKNFILFFSFTKSENRRVDQVLPESKVWYQWEGRGGGERVKDGEYGANTVYTCM